MSLAQACKHSCISGWSALSHVHQPETAAWLQEVGTWSHIGHLTAGPAHRAPCGERGKRGGECSRTEVEDVEIRVIHQVKFITHSLLWRWAAEAKQSMSVSTKTIVH